MLIKFKLVNVPQGGVAHLVDSRRYQIDENLTDEDAGILIKAGVSQYFEPVETSESNEQDTDPKASENATTGETGKSGKTGKSGSK